MVIKSLLTIQNTLHSLADIREWIADRNRTIQVCVEPIPFSLLENWYQDRDGSLRHTSGRFFSN